MRLLFVFRNIHAPGAEAAETREMIKVLLRRGFEVGVLCAGGPDLQVPEISGATLLPLTGPATQLPRKMARAIAAFAPQVAHIKSLWTPFHPAAGRALAQSGIPYIVEPGGHLYPYNLTHRANGRKMTPVHLVGRWLYKKCCDLPLCRHASGIRALSDWEARVCRQQVNTPVTVIPLGINAEWVTGVHTATPVRAADAPLRANFLGRFDVAQKGLDLVLDAFKRIRAVGKTERIRARLAGPDVAGSTEWLKQRVARLGLTNVSVEGPCFGPDKAHFLSETDVFLHPSRMEETAKLAREATGAGIPVLASEASNYGQWVSGEGSGAIVELNGDSIAQTLLDLAEDRGRLARMTAATATHAAKFTWDFVVDQLLPFYERIAGSAESREKD